MHKCTEREDDTQNCMITAQYWMLELIFCWNIRKKFAHLWKGETKKQSWNIFQEHLRHFKNSFSRSDDLQVLSLWRHQFFSLCISPQTANQEKILLKDVSEGEQGSFTDVCREATALVKNTGHLMKGYPFQKWLLSQDTVPNQISVNKLLPQHKRKMQTQKTQDKQQVLYRTQSSVPPQLS